MNTLSITSVEPAGWGDRFNRLPKQNEIDQYPAFAIVPARDTQEDLDNWTDDDRVTYSVYILMHYHEGSDAEETTRALVDLVRTALRKERRSVTPLGNAAYSLSIAGEWGFDVEQGERFYRLDVTAKVAESLLD
jgi:hypothetical protein